MGGELFERRAGAAVGLLAGVEAVAAAAAAAVAAAAAGGSASAEVVLVAAEGVWDEEALPCDWAEMVAEAWNCVELRLKTRKRKIKQNEF